MNKIFVARTRSALKSRAQLGSLDLNDFVILKLNDKARKNSVIKSVVPQVEDEDYKFIMMHKSFVVITTDGGLSVNTNMIGKNSYAEELNTPEEEAPGDKFVVDGKVKSLLAKIAKTKDFSDDEKEELEEAVKSWGEHHGEEVSKDEEFVDELGETKSSHSEEDDEDEDETKSKADDKDAEENLKSMRDQVRSIEAPDAKNDLMASLKSFGSIDDKAPVFQDKHAAARFVQVYNNKIAGTERAEVESADRHVRQRYGTKARFVVTFN